MKFLRIRAARLIHRLGVKNDQGTAMVEMAVVLPVLLLLMTGMCTLGITCNYYLELTDAVSIAGRQLAISRSATLDPCASVYANIKNAAPFLNASQITLTTTIGTDVEKGNTCSGTLTSGPPSELVQGAVVTVTATYPCTVAVYGNANIAPGCTLHAQVTELEQ
jgi:Flp pilus assembly protein TadG